MSLPDPSLVDVYKTGFIYTQIIRSGDELKTANHLNYLPCSMTEPNTDNRCANAEDAN